jgi:hypothetical protein
MKNFEEFNFRGFKMFRNQYDSDVTIWSPQGRLHQVFPKVPLQTVMELFLVHL